MNIIILYNASTYQNLTGQILHCSVRSFHLLRQDASGQPIFLPQIALNYTNLFFYLHSRGYLIISYLFIYFLFNYLLFKKSYCDI